MYTTLLTQGKILADIVTVATISPGFTIPDFGTVLTFVVRTFFVIGGVFALIYLLLGAFAWITSGGNKENVDKARDKIQAAIVGLILMLVILAVVALLESVLGIGLGITKQIKFTTLSTPTQGF